MFWVEHFVLSPLVGYQRDGLIFILNIAIVFLLAISIVFFHLLTDSLLKTPLESSRCLALFEKALDCCLWACCPTEEPANCFKPY